VLESVSTSSGLDRHPHADDVAKRGQGVGRGGEGGSGDSGGGGGGEEIVLSKVSGFSHVEDTLRHLYFPFSNHTFECTIVKITTPSLPAFPSLKSVYLGVSS
jgi:hypothetical protein